MIKEFKEFISRGSAMDMAVGLIMGAAFTAIIKSLVDDIIMPILGLFTQGIDFSNRFIPLDGKTYASLAQAEEAGAAVIRYGMFLNAIISFLLISFVIFLMVKNINRLRRKDEEAKPTTKDCDLCAMSIPVEAKKCPYCLSDQTIKANL